MAEVEAYLEHIDSYVAPYASLPSEIVASLNLPETPDIPPCLLAVQKCEEFGFPNPGTWLDQPVDWMEDIEAAKRGRWRARRKTRQTVDVASIFRSAPTGETL